MKYQMTDYQLYSRVLRLSHTVHPSMSDHDVVQMDNIVKEVVLPDSKLVWC